MQPHPDYLLDPSPTAEPAGDDAEPCLAGTSPVGRVRRDVMNVALLDARLDTSAQSVASFNVPAEPRLNRRGRRARMFGRKA